MRSVAADQVSRGRRTAAASLKRRDLSLQAGDRLDLDAALLGDERHRRLAFGDRPGREGGRIPALGETLAEIGDVKRRPADVESCDHPQHADRLVGGSQHGRERYRAAAEGAYTAPVPVLKTVFWGSLGALAWTHVGYPVAAEIAARLRTRPVRKDDGAEPSVAVDHRRVQRGTGHRAAAREPPRARLPGREARDRRRVGCLDRPDERDRRRRSPRVSPGSGCSTARGAARSQRRTGPSRETSADVLAFSDGNATWAPDALRRLVANLADPDVAYVCGQLRLETAAGTNREGTYWRYEMKLREAESQARFGHRGKRLDLRRQSRATTSRSIRAGATTSRSRTGWCRRVGVPSTSPTRTPSRSRRRRTRPSTAARCGCSSTAGRSRCAGRCSDDLPPGYLVEIVSHRLLRYGSGVLHLALLASSVALVGDGWAYGIVLAGQVALIALAAAGIPIARYYALVTWATIVALWNYLRRGVPATWEAAEGTR